MNIGLYFGSFNPIHIGHLIIANHVLNETSINRIWFVVSPQNPFKESKTLLNEFDRLHLVRLATQDDNRIKSSDIEFNLPKPSYTSNTLISLAEKYPEHQFALIMDAPIIQISASQIREHIRSRKSIRYLVHEIVREEIESRKFYRQKD